MSALAIRVSSRSQFEVGRNTPSGPTALPVRRSTSVPGDADHAVRPAFIGVVADRRR